MTTIPEFAIIGHPNEGKSSVLSTLAEDDSVRVSSTPGETTVCRTFPVLIDGREMLRFTDTPGFQNPGRVLSELKKRFSESIDPIKEFRVFAASIPELHDDSELLAPLERGAGIIYIVDGSRPVRNVDRAEMEILRLSGRPRMAIINCKEDEEKHLEAWKNEFRKNFNSNRRFNAHRATYSERISLLEALKSIDQDWQDTLDEVVSIFKADWQNRNNVTADIITTLLHDALTFTLHENINTTTDTEQTRQKLFTQYSEKIRLKERNSHTQIKRLFKHNIFNYELPQHSLLHEDLFDKKTWQLLGLTQKQLIIAGGIGGAAIGASLDVAALGHGLGMFTAVGSMAGALGAFLGGEKFSEQAEILGVSLGGNQIQIGPTKSIDLLFVLLNRSLLFYQYTINWAHGRRDYESLEKSESDKTPASGFTRDWPASRIKVCHAFFKSVQKINGNASQPREEFRKLLLEAMEEITETK
jgi:GTP-binding protein EngB required for normal cell division